MYFKKGQVIACNHNTQLSARKSPDIKIKNIYQKYIKITTHAQNLMNYFKSQKVVKITANTKEMIKH